MASHENNDEEHLLTEQNNNTNANYEKNDIPPPPVNYNNNQQHYSSPYPNPPSQVIYDYENNSNNNQQHYSLPPQQQVYSPPLVSPSHYSLPPNQQFNNQSSNPYGYQPQYVEYDPNGSILEGGTIHDLPPRKAESARVQIKELPKRMIQAITKPKKENFEDLKLSASWNMAFVLLAFKIVWAIIIESIAYAAAGVDGVGYAILGAILGTLFFFFFFNGLLHGLSLCLGGGAHGVHPSVLFLQLCYLTLLYGTPLDIAELLTVIPIVGWIINIALTVYRFVLFVLTLQAIYKISVAHSIIIIVIYIIVVLILFLSFAFAISGVWGALVLRVL